MSGKMSRDKGARFELSLAHILKDEYGYHDAVRTAQHCGKNGGQPDVKGVPGLHIECKAQEKMHLYDWVEQAVRDSEGTGNLPAVFHKQNRKGILVTMPIEAFMEVFREYSSSVELKQIEGDSDSR